jgi:CSLREA domain-containing protein
MNRRSPLAPTRLLPLGVLLMAAVVGCDDHTLPTALGPDGVAFTQVASAPVVNSLADPGDGVCDATECTLREAIAFASGGATITFSVTGTILLDRALLSIDKGLTISGPGAQQLVVDANSGSRVFSVSSGPVTIAGITITGGVTPHTGGGAGIFNWGALTVRDCVITGNNSYPNWGGGIHHASGTLTVVSSAISGNNGHTKYGSGIANYAELTVLNSTISGNTSSGGGLATGIYTYGAGETSIAHSTITDHSTGILSEGGAVGAVKVKGSILWGNSTADAAGSAGTVTSLGYNLVGVGGDTVFNATGDVVNVTDALLGTLQLNSPGTTPTHALLTGSPAIDTGTCTDHAGAAVITDQRGISRPQGAACDKGAYEKETTAGKAPGSVTINNIPTEATYGGSFTPTYTMLGDGTVSTLSSTPSICSVSSGVVNFDAAGTCTLVASVTEGTDHQAATGDPQSFTIGKAAGSVTIDNIPAGAVFGGSFTPSYSKLGDGTASTSSSTPSICSVNSGMVTFDAAGTCTLVASVTEGTNYQAATGSAQSFDIAKAATSVSIANMPASALVGGGFTPAYTTDSDGATSTASNTPAVCTVSGGAVSFIAEGTCTLVASVAEGTNHVAATGSEQSVMVSPPGPPAEFTSSCTYTLHPKNGQRLVTVAWENAVPGVTLIQLVDGRTVTKQMAPTTTGSWSTNVKEDPTYALSGGEGRKDTSVQLVGATPCEGPN